ncbi:unnamed protein product [Menidia menidia]|uniref:(Atlantic silverside) hypothetical protein n=1 Tax=Menidia menidia TaxID=238744 RepID=A0A8S4BLU7_9TELE|nr:unnamed protein product [Menidia menidia]
MSFHVRFLTPSSCPNPADRTVSMEGNGRGSSHFFSFNTFQFSGGNSGSVFLHCKVKLCVSQGDQGTSAFRGVIRATGSADLPCQNTETSTLPSSPWPGLTRFPWRLGPKKIQGFVPKRSQSLVMHRFRKATSS